MVTNQTIFYTQLGSIIVFIVSLFVLYRILVSTKDATIETLKTQVSLLETKIKDLSETSPDILLQRNVNRVELLTRDLGSAEEEKALLAEQINELKKQLTESNTKSEVERQKLVSKLVLVSQNAGLLDAKHQQLTQKLREVEEPYLKFLHYANAEVSPRRSQIVSEIVRHLGIEYIIASKPQDLVKTFSTLSNEIKKYGMHPNARINGGAMTGLRGIGLINDKDELTLIGISEFKRVAKELKSNNELQPTS